MDGDRQRRRVKPAPACSPATPGSDASTSPGSLFLAYSGGEVAQACQPVCSGCSLTVPSLDLVTRCRRYMEGKLCPDLSRQGQDTELLQQAKIVRIFPLFDDFAVHPMADGTSRKYHVLVDTRNPGSR